MTEHLGPITSTTPAGRVNESMTCRVALLSIAVAFDALNDLLPQDCPAAPVEED